MRYSDRCSARYSGARSVADGHARGRGRGRGRQRGRGIGINLLIFSSLLTLGAREFAGAADAAVIA